MPAQPSPLPPTGGPDRADRTDSTDSTGTANRAERRAARRAGSGRAGRSVPAGRLGHTRGAQGRRVNPIRRGGS